MGNRLVMILLIAAIPLFGYLVSSWIQWEYDSQLREAIIQAFPNADETILQEFTVSVVCDDPDIELSPAERELCSIYSNLDLMKSGSVVAGSSGAALAILIKIAGLFARISRRVLLVVFKPGLYFTSITLMGLILVHASIAMGSIYYIAAWFGRIPVGFIVAIGLGGLIGFFVLASSMLAIVKKAQTRVIGLPVNRDRAPKLYEKIESTAERLGALPPNNIVLGLDPNFFVTEADVVCVGDRLSGRTLYCSLPLCRIMSNGEFDAVIGHELGHFKGQDTAYTLKFYPIYRGTATALAELKDASSVVLLPAFALLSYFYDAFSAAENTHSREREFAADNEGAYVTSAETLGTALVKVHAFAPFWSHFQTAAVDAIRDDRFFVNASKTFAEAMKMEATDNVLVGIAETHTSHPTDSHPPLAARLVSLNVSLESVATQSLNVQPETMASSIVDNVESLEEEISEAYQVVLAHYVRVVDEAEEMSGSTRGESQE